MKITKYTILNLFLVTQQASAVYETLDYNDVREIGGFNSRLLANVGTIITSEDSRTATEKEVILKSTNLFNLRRLDLGRQDVDDAFIITLCKNKTFKRLIDIDLSRNQKITSASLEAILPSSMGRTRDSFQMSDDMHAPAQRFL